MKSQDPYEPDARMPEGRWIKGRYRGQRIDTRERRSLRILRGAQAEPYSPAAGEIVAANFTHDGRFWVAKFPRDAVKRVIFQKWDFGEMRVPLLDFQIFHVAHTEIRFALGRDITLFAQGGPPEPHPEKIRDIVTSVETVGPPGTSFNIIGGLLNHFVAVRRFKSLEENYFERVVCERRTIQQWDVDIPENKKETLFSAAIAQSDRDGMNVLYHVFRRSCTTEAFRLIDSVMDYGIRTWRSRVFKRAPHFPEAYLWARRLLKPGGGSRMPSLNEEKREWRDSPRMRARKSEYLDARRRERGSS